MAEFELNPGETLIKEGNVQVRAKMTMNNGKGYLTNERFVQLSRPNLMMWFGLVGMIISNLIFKPKVIVEFPLSNIESLKHGKIMLNNNVMQIKTSDGEEHTLLMNWDQWFSAFQEALRGAKLQLVERGEKEWAVAKA